MIELTIDSTAFAITPVPLSEPWRVVATHAGRKQADCQGNERTRSWLLASTGARARDPLLAQRHERMSFMKQLAGS